MTEVAQVLGVISLLIGAFAGLGMAACTLGMAIAKTEEMKSKWVTYTMIAFPAIGVGAL